MLSDQIIKKISFSRYLYSLAEDNIKSGNPVKLSAGIILLQDAVEIFLIALAEHVGASLEARMEFDKYFVEINKKIAPKELPLKTKLIALNKLRVNTKHFAIQPAPEECEHFLISVSDFFDAVSLEHLGQAYGSINLIDLIDKGEVKDLLSEARDSYIRGDYRTCLINCSKAIYLEFLQQYTIETFKNGEPTGFLGILASKSPYYTRNPQYIAANVKDPSDYLVIDHSSLDKELMQNGIEHSDFWNVQRFAPKVYKLDNGEWVVKNELNKLEEETIKANSEFVLNTTIDIVLKLHRSRRSAKKPPLGRYYIELKSEKTNVYEKADKKSKVINITPEGVKQVYCDFNIKGLNDNDIYWHAAHLEEGIYLFGYIHQEDIVLQ